LYWRTLILVPAAAMHSLEIFSRKSQFLIADSPGALSERKYLETRAMKISPS